MKKKYWAFISYSSKDARWGKWLHAKLENYSIFSRPSRASPEDYLRPIQRPPMQLFHVGERPVECPFLWHLCRLVKGTGPF